MLFTSSVFLFLFLPGVLIVYYCILKWNRFLQNIFLFIMSIVFYAWGEPKFVLVLISSIIVNWLLGLWIEKSAGKRVSEYTIITLTLIFNLSVIFIFKYLIFSVESLNYLLGIKIRIPQIALPIGISFFTFQAITYVIDIYRKKGKAQRNPFNVGLYIAFFPQLIAGPIVRYETVAEEIIFRHENMTDFTSGIYRFIIGFCKKVLIANNVAIIANKAFLLQNNQLSLSFAWLGAISYTFQIYFDFSGYSDMAIGLGKMFGFHFLENFNYPYISKSISEFWRRWHISLGTFFKDYVYFPLGGSRVKTKVRLLFNLSVVWLLTGIWHGANWTFICWGLFYLILLVIEKLIGWEKRLNTLCKSKVHKWVLSIGQHFYTMLFVVIGWVIFNSSSLTNAIKYLSVMFGITTRDIIDNNFILYINEYKWYFVVAIIFSIPIGLKVKNTKLANTFAVKQLEAVAIILLFVIAVSFVIKGSYNPFIYFNF